MNHLQVVLQWVIAALAAAAATLAASQTIRPDCQHKCGNVIIPYPFGTSEGCYLNEFFFMRCNTSSTPPKPFLWNSTIEAVDISLDGQLRIYTDVARACFDKNGKPVQNESSTDEVSIELLAFPFSVTRNKFIAVGCDTLGLFGGTTKEDNSDYASGCLSMCSTRNSTFLTNGTCSGIGCCETPIPKIMFNYNATVVSVLDNHKDVWDFNPCSYSFLVDEQAFNFSTADLRDLHNRTVPSVLDWAIGNQTCKEAKNNMTSYACGRNTLCVDSDNGPGYRCNCSKGYRGNPYLQNGCQDIDECLDSKLNDCAKNSCVNKPGSYTCHCPKGYRGDGRKDGDNYGCVPVSDQLLVIKIVVGVTASLMVLLVGSTWAYWGRKKRKLMKLKEKFFQQNGGLMLQQQVSSHAGSVETAKIWTTKELKKATNNYDASRVLGQGGNGTVYRGVLPDNKVVAIKKSKIGDRSQIEQFINEVVVLSQINHRNVVKLIGCCLETEVPLLVYEFVTNGTLSEHIHQKQPSSLSWEMRMKIATETAGALAYLHFETSFPIIHRDVKTTNILLDDTFTAKVADFGASRLVPLDQTQLTTLVQGTLGYLDPEYFHTSKLTGKSDVYSFGVVLAELLTGQHALSFARPESDRNLAMFFVSSMKEDRLIHILDSDTVNEGNIEQAKEVANLAKRCLRVRGEERPTMKEVAMEMEGLRIMEKHPWGKVDQCSEETEYLPSAPTDSYSIDVGISYGSSSTTAGYDTMRNQVLKPLDGGR